MTPHLRPVGDPVIFENASICLEAVQTALEREGHFEEAMVLYGLEVMNPAGIEVALDALRSLVVSTPESAEAIAMTIGVLEQASKIARARRVRAAA